MNLLLYYLSFLQPQSELELEITVTDEDTFIDDDVDVIIVPFNSRQRANGEFSSATSYTGSCGKASIVVSISITRLCPTPNTYGQFCDQTCIEQPGQTNCNYLGQLQCLGTFAAPDCITCIANYYPPVLATFSVSLEMMRRDTILVILTGKRSACPATQIPVQTA